jgi:YceI-like domain
MTPISSERTSVVMTVMFARRDVGQVESARQRVLVSGNISRAHEVCVRVENERAFMRTLTIIGSAALITWLVASGVSGAQSHSWTMATGDVRVTCPLTVGGSFEARTTALKGRLSVDPATTALAGELSVALKTLDTGISLRNQHMLDNYLEVQKSEDFETAVLSNIDVGPLTSGVAKGQSRFTARLRLHGTTQEGAGQATISERGASVRVEASFPVRISDYAISDPRYLGVGVKNEVVVRVVFLANEDS